MPTHSSASGDNDPVTYLDLDDLVALASLLLGDPPPIRDVGLLGSAVARPRTTVFSKDAYPDLGHKAAALLHSLVKNHALVDGNKRLGWLATATFLELNGTGVTHVGNDEVVDLVTDVAANRREVSDIAAALVKLVSVPPGRPAQPEAQGRARGSS
jgi:death on curing protein